MNKRILGHTGIEVSEMCLGVMRFGSTTDQATSFRLMDMYAEAGGRFFDTANAYGDKDHPRGSEKILGEWVRAKKNRADVFITTKVGCQQPRGLSKDLILQECEASLKALQIDTIDMLVSHVDDRNTPLAETLGAYNELVQAGKVRFLGASNTQAWRLMEAEAICRANGWRHYCSIQQVFSYFRPRPGTGFVRALLLKNNGEPPNSRLLDGKGICVMKEVDSGIQDYCCERNVSIVAHSALLCGAYVRPDRWSGGRMKDYAHADSEKRLEVLQEVAAAKGASPNQVVLAWMLKTGLPIIPLFSASNEQQMEDNLGYANVELTENDLAQLNQAGI